MQIVNQSSLSQSLETPVRLSLPAISPTLSKHPFVSASFVPYTPMMASPGLVSS
jgi:hypothetical protein